MKCTRLDAQRTIDEPIADSEQIWERIRNRTIWLPGYTGYTQGSVLNSAGQATGGASTTWGRPTAAVRCTTYNKAIEQKIFDQRAVRHEVRCRSAAAEGYFDALMTALEQEGEETENTTAERIVCSSILRKHMTYMDTTRYSHIKDRTKWPKNWKREVVPADFMDEVLEGDFVEVKPAKRLHKRLAERKAWADKQCGATYALWLLAEELTFNPDINHNVNRLLDCWFSRLKDDQVDELEQITGLRREFLLEEISRYRRQACEAIEHDDDDRF